MSRFGRILQTSTFRLAFLGAVLFAVMSLGLLGSVRWMTGKLLDQRVDLAIEAELERLHTIYDQGGTDAVIAEIDARGNSLQGRQRVYLLQTNDGQILAGNIDHWPDPADDNHYRFTAPDSFADAGSPVRAEESRLGQDLRLLNGRLQVDRLAFEKVIDRTMLLGALFSLLLGLAVGGWMARRTLRRLDDINRMAESILSGQRQQRVTVTGVGDEFDHLSLTLNDMLDRIDRLLQAMRAVTRNIAHDLRTPLNRLRNRLELALLESPDAPVLAAAINDVDSILSTFNALLSIARLEGRPPRENFRPIDLDQLIQDIGELYAPLAEDQGLRLEVQTKAETVIDGDHQLLSQALANLLDNAIKYSSPGGHIALAVTVESQQACLSVSDNGPGIPPALRGKVLEPFVRLSESRNSPGAGLGLSLVAAIAEAHGANLSLEDAEPGLKVVLRLSLPQHGQRINYR